MRPGPGSAFIAVDAAPRGNAAVPVGASEAGVDGDLLHPAAEAIPQVAVETIVSRWFRCVHGLDWFVYFEAVLEIVAGFEFQNRKQKPGAQLPWTTNAGAGYRRISSN
jgi:hypothetical protein